MYRRQISLTIALFICSVPVIAQWNPDPSVNTPVSLAPGWQSPAAIHTDGTGGVIAVWLDKRNYPASMLYDVYAQRLDRSGSLIWRGYDKPMCEDVPFDEYFQILDAPNHGFCLVWEENADSAGTIRSLSAARRKYDAAPLWKHEGIFPLTHSRGKHFTAAADGKGGVYIFQSYVTKEDGGDIYGQYINSSGIKQWGAYGKVVVGVPEGQLNPVAIPSPWGGVYLAWEDDSRYNPATGKHEVYLQHLNPSGIPVWTNGPLLITGQKERYERLAMMARPDGNIVIAWSDTRYTHPETGWISDDTVAVFAQCITPNGDRMWGEAGVFVSYRMPISSKYPTLISGIQLAQAPNNAIMATWGTNAGDYYAQRIHMDGIREMNVGYAVFLMQNTSHANYRYGMVTDGLGGAYLTYIRQSGNEYSLQSLHFDNHGNIGWVDKPVSEAPGTKDITFGSRIPHAMADNAGGFFIAWSDGRRDMGDVYMSRIGPDGNPFPVELASFTGTLIESNVVLQWETESETSNRGFTVQRSTDFVRWEDAGFVEGRGTASMRNRYSFTDRIPSQPGNHGSLYYRLLQYDFDGQQHYSPVIEIALGRQSAAPRMAAVNPNPVINDATVRFSIPEALEAVFTLVNQLGQIVYTHKGMYEKGNGTVAIPMSRLNPGIYFLRMTTPQGISIQKIVKQAPSN